MPRKLNPSNGKKVLRNDAKPVETEYDDDGPSIAIYYLSADYPEKGVYVEDEIFQAFVKKHFGDSDIASNVERYKQYWQQLTDIG